MNRIIIFGGTTEGRKLATELAKLSVHCLYLVATDYGKMVTGDMPNVDVRIGRLDAEQMAELFRIEKPIAIVDATHPYAEIVKKEIEKARENFSCIPFFRLLRKEEQADFSGCKFFENAEECANALKETKGTVFLTTGSKDLPVFCREKSLSERLVVRVIPNEESLKICYDCGLLGSQIIAMQGPFSLELNLTLFKDKKAAVVVMKESGKAGGELERIEAARKANAECYIIKRPFEKQNGQEYSLVKENILKLLGKNSCNDSEIETKKKPEIILAGYGMGKGSMTLEVEQAVKDADIIFGASRMLEGISAKCRKFPYYLPEDIIPVIEKSASSKIVILFSGDTGFYSGAGKMYKALKAKGYEPKVYPGISSVSALCARIGEDWQNAKIISTHGIDKELWICQIISNAIYERQIIAITSGAEDVKIIGELLSLLEDSGRGKYLIYAGFNMYGDEKLLELTPKQCMDIEKKGLYTVFIKNVEPLRRRIVPGIGDNEFIRDKVPMTKGEIRALSICKLGVTEGDVIYDIGGGTGSVSVELGLLSSSVKVYCIEKKPEAAELIRKNIDRFHLKNVVVIEGEAPFVLSGIKEPDKVFIGGSSDGMKDIFEKLISYKKKVRVVVNAVTLETIAKLNDLIKEYNIKDPDIVQVQISKAKKAGNYTLMEAGNPVYIVSFTIS